MGIHFFLRTVAVSKSPIHLRAVHLKSANHLSTQESLSKTLNASVAMPCNSYILQIKPDDCPPLSNEHTFPSYMQREQPPTLQ